MLETTLKADCPLLLQVENKLRTPFIPCIFINCSIKLPSLENVLDVDEAFESPL